MKKFILAVAAFSMMFCAVSFAQEGGDRSEWREQVRAEKKAFLQKELGLDENDAFWAVYDAVQDESAALMKARMEARRDLRRAVKDGKSESEIAPLLKAFMDADAACIDFKKTSAERYSKALSAEKMARLIFAEEKFMHRQMNMRGGEGGNGRGHGRGGHGRGHGRPGNGGPGFGGPGQGGPGFGGPGQGGPGFGGFPGGFRNNDAE